MKDFEREEEIKQRLADRYTSAEICEFLDVPVEYIIDEFWDKILDNLEYLLEDN